MANFIPCHSIAGMDSALVNIRVHHDNGFINYYDSGVDLSQFQYVDTTVSNPLHMRHGDGGSKFLVKFQGNVSMVGAGNCTR